MYLTTVNKLNIKSKCFQFLFLKDFLPVYEPFVINKSKIIINNK